MVTVYYLHRLDTVDIRTMYELKITGSAGMSRIICGVIYTALSAVCVRIVNNKLYFPFSFLFLSYFYFILLLFSIFGLRVRVSMMSHIGHMS